MNNIEIRISSDDGQVVDGGVFFSISGKDIRCYKNEQTKRKTMEKKELKNIEIYELIADYVYELFKIFNNKYESAPIKVQKLLFVAEMVSIYRYKKSLFPDDVVFECNHCGFKIPTFTDYTKDFISNGVTANEIIIPTDEEIIKINELNTFYMLKGIKSPDINIISDTVVNFGKYNPITLGQLLNDFKSNSQSSKFKQQPPFLFTKREFFILLNNLDNLKGKNVIADFILDYDISTESGD